MNKRKSNYIYIEMRHKKLMVGVVITHVWSCNNSCLFYAHSG